MTRALRDVLEDAAELPLAPVDIDRVRGNARSYGRRRAAVRLGTPLVALVATATLVAVLVNRSGGPSQVVAPPPSVASGLTPTRFSLGGLRAISAVSGDGGVWVGADRVACAQPADCGVVVRVDPVTGNVVATISVGADPIDLAAAADGIWILDDLPNGGPYHLAHIDPSSNQIDLTATISSAVTGNGNPGAHLAVSPGAVWVALDDAGGPRLVRVDATTGETVATIALLDADAAHAIAVDTAGVWVESFASGHVTRVDPITNQITGRVQLGDGFLNSLAADESAVWATQAPGTSTGASTLVRIDPASGQIVARLPIPATTVAVANGQVWVTGYNPDQSRADARPGYVARIDPTTNRVSAAGEIATTLNDTQILAVGTAGTWIATGNSGILDRIAAPPRTTTAVTAEGCPTTFVLPFAPRYIPTGWRPVAPHTAHAMRGTDAIEVWAGTDKSAVPYGIIEVWRGASIPSPVPPITTVTVLGGHGQFGRISDGSAIVFNTGDPRDPCTRWALVAHPGTTPDILRAVAEQLSPVTNP